MGRKSPRKGARIEREIVQLHQEAGVPAVRVVMSGALGHLVDTPDLAGDVRVFPGTPDELVAEVKSRSNGSGFVTLEKWLGTNDLLFLRRDRQRPLVVMPWRVYRRLLQDRSVDRQTQEGETL